MVPLVGVAFAAGALGSHPPSPVLAVGLLYAAFVLCDLSLLHPLF